MLAASLHQRLEWQRIRIKQHLQTTLVSKKQVMSLSLSWQPRQHWFRKQPDQFKRAWTHPFNIKEGKLYCQSSVTSLSLFCQQFLADYQTYSKNQIPCLSVDSAHEKGWTSASGFLPNGILWQSTLFIYSFSGCERGQVSLRVHVEETQRTTIQCLFLEITLNKLDTEAVERGQATLDDQLALAVSLTPNGYACQFFFLLKITTLFIARAFSGPQILKVGGKRGCVLDYSPIRVHFCWLCVRVDWWWFVRIREGWPDCQVVGRHFQVHTHKKKKQATAVQHRHSSSQRRSAPVWHLSKMIPSRSRPLHYSLTSLSSWECCAFWQFQAFLNN